MKKLFVLLLCLVLAAALLVACTNETANEPTEPDYSGTFRVGFGRVNITPELGIGLAGMGDDATRKAKDIESKLYMTCIAVTDENENTVLLMTSDSIRTETWVCDLMRDMIHSELGVPRENIFSSTTHTHNAPDTIRTEYTVFYQQAGLEACKKAMEDRRPAEMYTGTTEAEGLNFVRHYVMEDAEGNRSIVGPNYGDETGKTYVGHETEVDNSVQLIKFVREGFKDIILMNFRGHPIVSAGGHYTSISAGYIDDCRSTMEEELKCHFAYFQGASGNVSDTSEIVSENNFRTNYTDLGEKLAYVAIDYLDSLEKVNTGAVEVKTVNYYGNVRVDSQEYITAATKFNNVKKTGGSMADAIKASGNLCFCPQALSCIEMRQQQYKIGKGQMALEMGAISIGDVAFISSPWEMFDNTGMQIKEGSPYEQTFVMYLSNGRGKYLPSEPAYSNGCYEKELSYFVKGTAEEVAGLYIDMLEELAADGMIQNSTETFSSQLPNDT